MTRCTLIGHRATGPDPGVGPGAALRERCVTGAIVGLTENRTGRRRLPRRVGRCGYPATTGRAVGAMVPAPAACCRTDNQIWLVPRYGVSSPSVGKVDKVS